MSDEYQAAEFYIGDNDYSESEVDCTTMHLSTSINNRPVRVTVEFEEPTDLLGLFYHLGKPESLENLAESLRITYQEKQLHDALNEVNDGTTTLEELLGDS